MSEGRRCGVPASEIAATIEDIFAYLESSKASNTELIAAIRNEATQWRDRVLTLRGADQASLDAFFGQPASRDIETALAAQGITHDAVDETTYDDAFGRAYQHATVDRSCYWPGRVVPTLHDYRRLLCFDAYRERLDGVDDGPAARLIARLDSFQGGMGRVHLALTSFLHCLSDYVNSTPRHPSEVYTEPPDVPIDYLNAAWHTYTTYLDWQPSDDMRQVSAAMHVNGSAEDKFQWLAHERAKARFALECGGIDATVDVRLGQTYGGDAVVITMSMQDYTDKYLRVLLGERELDQSRAPERMPVHSVDVYTGYQPGSDAFFQDGDLLVALTAMERIAAASQTEGPSSSAVAALKFLSAGFVRTSTDRWPVAPGIVGDFVRLSPDVPVESSRVYRVEGRYYTGVDIDNEVNRCLFCIQAVVTGREPTPPRQRVQEIPDGTWFQQGGDVYIPKGEAYYQIALRMKFTYGVDFDWVIRNERAQRRAGDTEKYVLLTSALEQPARSRAIGELSEWLADVRKGISGPDDAAHSV